MTGIDITPAMLDRARMLATERGLTNVAWRQGDETLRRIFRDPLANDDLGMGTRRVGDQIHFGYPVAVLAARRP